MKRGAREAVYTSLARASGLLLIVVCVLFQRRGLMDWSEVLFLGLCIGMQETFLRVHFLRRLRTPMLVFYSMMPLMLVLYHGAEIRALNGDFVQIVLYTPLPLVLISVQVMVLYVRESSRLVSVVLVLALFSTVIGVRRPLDDAIWPWLAGIGAAGSIFLMLQHPGMLFQGVYMNRRRGTLPPSGRPGGIVRGAFFSVLPLFTMSVLVTSLLLYFSIPRLQARSDGQGGYEIGIDPGTTDPGQGPSGPTDTKRQPDTTNPPPDPTGPASVSGLANGVDLGDFGEIKLSKTPALDVELITPEGTVVQQVYLRAFTYGEFDGSRWSPVTDGRVAEVRPGDSRRLPMAPSESWNHWRMRRYRVTLREAGVGAGGQLPMPVEPEVVSEYTGALYYDATSNTVTAPQAASGDSYIATVNQLVATQDQLRRELVGKGPASTPHPAYLQVPPALKTEIRRRFRRFYDRFAEEIRDPAVGVYATGLDIVRMFREAKLEGTSKPAWSYSLDFRPEPGADAIARFLDTETSKSERFGHCEYFASAMCVLMRCYGVPARVAAGFFATGPNDEGVFEVKGSSAHAWVEVYTERYGWVTFDPTPPENSAVAGADPVVEEPAQPDPTVPPDTAGAAGAEPPKKDWLRSYDSQAQQEVFRNVDGWFKDAYAEADGFLTRLMAWLPDSLFPKNGLLRAICLVVPPAIVLFVLVLRRRKRKKIEAKVLEQMGEGGRKRERSLYFQLLLLLAGYGFQKRASETPREFASRVMRRGGNQHEPVVELTEIYYGLRFGLADDLEAEFKQVLTSYSEALRAEQRELRSGSSASGPIQRPV